MEWLSLEVRNEAIMVRIIISDLFFPDGLESELCLADKTVSLSKFSIDLPT